MGFISAGINAGVTGVQNRKNREFAEQQAQLDRDFQAKQAELAREFQTEMYDTRLSPEAQLDSQMAGYEKNGINPALMFGKSAPTSGAMPSTSIPQGRATSFTPMPLGASSSFNLLQDAKVLAEIDGIAADIKLKEQQVNESVVREFVGMVNGSIGMVNLSEQLQTSEERVNAVISEYKSTQLDWELYEKHKDGFSEAIKWNNKIPEENYKKTQDEIKEIQSRTGLNKANVEYLQSLKFGQDIANEINLELKDDTIRNADSKLDLETLINRTRQTYIAKTGMDPFTFDSFKVMLMNALQPYVKSNDKEAYEALLKTIDPHSAVNIGLALSRDVTQMIGTAAGVAVNAKSGKGATASTSVPYPAQTNSTYYVD